MNPKIDVFLSSAKKWREEFEMGPTLKAYIYEAVETPALKTAFAALTPGRQRAYILYFSAPKQSKTRESRVEKCMQQILNGKGLNDR